MATTSCKDLLPRHVTEPNKATFAHVPLLLVLFSVKTILC